MIDEITEIQKNCFQIISMVGEAKSCYLESIAFAREGNFDEANKMLAAGRESFILGHKAHAALITLEAKQEKFEVSLLLIHAETQLMDAENTYLQAKEFLEIYNRLNKT